MNIAIITYDEDLKNKLISVMPEHQIKSYIDSISMLKDLDNFNPTLILYDASTGDFAQEDLKFLISRNKVKDKTFKVLYSKLNPINQKDFSGNIQFYEKESEINKLIEDIKKEFPQISKEENVNFEEESSEATLFSSPEDIEKFYSSEDNQQISEVDEMFINPTIEELQTQEQKHENLPIMEEIEENLIPQEEFLTQKPHSNENKEQETQKLEENITGTQSFINITVDKNEIERGIISLAVDKLVENLKNDPEIKEITNTISRDFVEKINEEINQLKEEIKKEFKENLSKRLEEEINAILKQELKDYIAKITTKIVEERLNQIFKK